MKKGDLVKIKMDKDELSDYLCDLELNVADGTTSNAKADAIWVGLNNPETVWEILAEESEGFELAVTGKRKYAAPFLFKKEELVLVK
jgi:hypothetical protein